MTARPRLGVRQQFEVVPSPTCWQWRGQTCHRGGGKSAHTPSWNRWDWVPGVSGGSPSRRSRTPWSWRAPRRRPWKKGRAGSARMIRINLTPGIMAFSTASPGGFSFGQGSRDEAVELDEALQDFGIIDESLWRSESSWIPRAKGRPIPTNDVWIAAHVPRHGDWSRPGIGEPPGRIRRPGARNREGECHFCNGRRRWPSGALPVAVYRDRGLGRSNFFRPMPGSSALDITELAHLVQ